MSRKKGAVEWASKYEGGRSEAYLSWDVLIMAVPPGVRRVDELPHEYDHTLSSLAGLSAKLQQILPELDLEDPSWGHLEGQNYSIEFNIGKNDPCEGIMLHVRGDESALEPIRKLCAATGWAAFDTTEGDFIDFASNTAASGLNAWREYRNRVLPGAPEKGVRLIVPVTRRDEKS